MYNNQIVVLHIANVIDNAFSGVCVVVPQHIIAQQDKANVALVNIANKQVKDVRNQFEYRDSFEIEEFPEPYNRPDVVIFHEVYYKKYLKIASQLKKKNISYIIVPHGCLTYEAQRKKMIKKCVANFLLFNQFIRNSVGIQCLSEREMKNTKFGRVKFIGTNGITKYERKKVFERKEIKLVYIGRLDIYHKGLDLLLEAIKTIEHFMQEHNVKMYVYGPDFREWYSEIEKIIFEKELDAIVNLNHEVLSDEKKEVLLDCDIFVQTSRFEGMPMGILEALSYGIPCLITDGTGLGNLIKNYSAGWVAETKTESIAKELKNLILERNTWEEKSCNAQRLITEQFDWERIAEQTLDMYLHYIK